MSSSDYGVSASAGTLLTALLSSAAVCGGLAFLAKQRLLPLSLNDAKSPAEIKKKQKSAAAGNASREKLIAVLNEMIEIAHEKHSLLPRALAQQRTAMAAYARGGRKMPAMDADTIYRLLVKDDFDSLLAQYDVTDAALSDQLAVAAAKNDKEVLKLERQLLSFNPMAGITNDVAIDALTVTTDVEIAMWEEAAKEVRKQKPDLKPSTRAYSNAVRSVYRIKADKVLPIPKESPWYDESLENAANDEDEEDDDDEASALPAYLRTCTPLLSALMKLGKPWSPARARIWNELVVAAAHADETGDVSRHAGKMSAAESQAVAALGVVGGVSGDEEGGEGDEDGGAGEGEEEEDEEAAMMRMMMAQQGGAGMMMGGR